MTRSKNRICPYCHKKIQENTLFFLPFCSERCKNVDLNRWLSDYYHVPGSMTDNDEEAGSLPLGTEDDET
ncbi:MAG: DNA gyrase inhibitor YacG [Alphaproteobacteria bacterium]|nr:DNA gyrase inhibitor YacG [Alphaproteobacteria bacterium]